MFEVQILNPIFLRYGGSKLEPKTAKILVLVKIPEFWSQIIDIYIPFLKRVDFFNPIETDRVNRPNKRPHYPEDSILG